jgi:hypothetical protein
VEKERVIGMDAKNKHCCQLMAKFIDDPRIRISYYSDWRGYYLETTGIGVQLMFNCPWCGFKFPEDLSDKRAKIIKKECKIDPYDDEQAGKIPEEFKSEEWWKKRKL